MQYVRSISGSVTKTWNSINPATLSGAIDVVVVEQEDGSLACSPFHVRFGKFSLLRPYEKKVEFKVNGAKQDYAMKLGEGGEAFFVFETSEDIPEGLQTSPLISPATSPQSLAGQHTIVETPLQEPDYLDITSNGSRGQFANPQLHNDAAPRKARSELGNLTPVSTSPDQGYCRPVSDEWSGIEGPNRATLERSASEELFPVSYRAQIAANEELKKDIHAPRPSERFPITGSNSSGGADRSHSPPVLPVNEAVSRAISLSKKLSGSNIPTHISESGDLMLDMTGYKSSEEEALRAEVIARKILAEELEGNYDIGALIGADDRGNLWIYSSEEAKEAAGRKAGLDGLTSRVVFNDAASDPGYHSDEDQGIPVDQAKGVFSSDQSNSQSGGLVTPPQTPPEHQTAGDPNRNYAKTLRLTSEQLRALNLRSGPNTMSFSVNRATCQANMYYWTYNVPVVISDIDGTITKCVAEASRPKLDT